MLQISLLIGSYQSYDAVVVDGQNGGVIEACSHIHVGEVTVGDHTPIGDIQVIAVPREVARGEVPHLAVCVVAVEGLNWQSALALEEGGLEQAHRADQGISDIQTNNLVGVQSKVGHCGDRQDQKGQRKKPSHLN